MTQEHAKYDQEVIYGTTYDTYIYIYRKFTANSSMWGSLKLAPINGHLNLYISCYFNTMKIVLKPTDITVGMGLYLQQSRGGYSR